MKELEFLPLALIKEQLRIEPDDDAEDVLLIQMSHAAVDYASQYIGRPIPWKDPSGGTVPVPTSVVQALLLIVSDLFVNREGAMRNAELHDNPAVARFLHFYRVGMGV